MKKLRAIGLIPARWGSTRFPGKPLHPLAGKPLLQHVWERCRRARSLGSVIIATDDLRIAEAAFAWGAEVSLTSAKHLSGTDRIAEVARKLRGVSHIVNIQGDEPLIDPKLIDRLVRQMQRDPQIEMITAVHPFENPADARSPHQVKAVLDRQKHALYFSRSAIPFAREEATYFRHQGIYGYRRELLLQFVKWQATPLEKAEALEQLRALENGVKIHVVVTRSGSPGVDTPADARAIEKVLLAAPSAKRATASR
ncbi:MAG TPA: 3-deoxy-manno-octulosonate cytidylyltransferase [Chthoniobacterales bacterium]|jgi:3-deoxy-manno-octulosonate cytidylyltransferase (CMP-KDO synthetase)|nr:3-deoxy-manno-octulosonate cytidylyltransferase [Chthoniobacterales bacterium]